MTTVDPRIIETIEHFISLGFISQPYRIFGTEQAARAWVADEMQTGERAP